MKSFNVKSNAKRFARGIAAKHPELCVVAEPQPVNEGAREWLPAIKWTGETHLGMPQNVPDDIRDTCAFVRDAGYDMVRLAIDVRNFGARGSVIKNVSHVMEPAEWPAPAEKAETVTITKTRAVGQSVPSADVLAKLAADLPPPVKSSREEIDARRAARRERVAQEKAEGVRTAAGDKVKKISKKKLIIDLINRDGGATQSELEQATGWQRHTLRGYIAGTLRKILSPFGVINCERGNGPDVTRYVFVKHVK